MLLTGRRLLRDGVFVNFLKNTFSTAKRFGSEGCDSFIAGLESFVDECAKNKGKNGHFFSYFIDFLWFF